MLCEAKAVAMGSQPVNEPVGTITHQQQSEKLRAAPGDSHPVVMVR
jgi:hypothetical protein